MKKLLILILIFILLSVKQVKADLVYPANAVWIQDEGWPAMNKNILSTNLTKVINDLGTGNIEFAFVFVGYWNNSTNNINYQHDDAFFTNVINALHSVNVKAIAWAEAYNAPMDIRASNRQNIYNSIIACMNKGFDGYNDDIEPPLIGTHQDQIDYWNNLTPILHGMGKLNMPDVGFDWEQNTNQYLNVDYIVSMFYSSRSTLEDPQAPYYWQEEFGEYSGHNTPPASPVILGLMNYYGNTYPLVWQLSQVNKYLSAYGHPQLSGFSLWLYEYMGTNPTDWNQWNYWITHVNDTSYPAMSVINITSSPMSGIPMTFDGTNIYKAPSTPFYSPESEYLFNGTFTLTTPSQATQETHFSLFGDSDHSGGSQGYNVYTYAGGPYNLTSSANVNSLYFYCTATGNVKLAIYNATYYFISSWNRTVTNDGWFYHPHTLLTQSNPTSCVKDSWILINVPSVILPAGIYFIAIKGDTTGIIGVSGLNPQKVGGASYGYNQFITENYNHAFDNIFPTVEGSMGNEPSVYVPIAPPVTANYVFSQWEDGGKAPTRYINVNGNMTITAYYSTNSVLSKISGILKDKNNNPVSANIIVYLNGTNTIINYVNTNSSGHYSLQVPNGTYDIQFNLTNFYIPGYSIRLNSISITNDIYNLIKSITGNQTGNKVSIILDVNDSQNILIYSPTVSKISKNNTYISSVSSLSQLTSNTWFYQYPNLYIKITPTMISKLHVDGKFIKDESGNVVYLRGVNKGWESTPGWWHPIGGGIWDGIGVYDPNAVKANLNTMKSWGANAWRVHTNLEMWIKNPNYFKDQYRDVTYTKNYRDMLKEAITLAGERGIYVILDFYNVESCFDVSTACSEAQDPLPFPPYQTDANPPGTPDQIIPNAQVFCDVWKNVSIEFKDFNNVIFDLFNEPTGNDTAKNAWFNAMQDCIEKIRSVTDNIIMTQWDYGVWVNLDYPSSPHSQLDWVDDSRIQGNNIIYDFHVYRGNFHRTNGGREDSWNMSELLLGYQYTLVQDAISKNKALIVGEIGANMWNTGDALIKELAFFSNNLNIFNQWNLSYTAWVWTVPAHMQHGLLQNSIWIPPPNEAGQIFINKIAEGK